MVLFRIAPCASHFVYFRQKMKYFNLLARKLSGAFRFNYFFLRRNTFRLSMLACWRLSSCPEPTGLQKILFVCHTNTGFTLFFPILLRAIVFLEGIPQQNSSRGMHAGTGSGKYLCDPRKSNHWGDEAMIRSIVRSSVVLIRVSLRIRKLSLSMC